jgi:antirestriction protein ArdC
MDTTQPKLDLHQTITDRIVAQIDQGDAGTFRMPWSQAGGSGLPINVANQRGERQAVQRDQRPVPVGGCP